MALWLLSTCCSLHKGVQRSFETGEFAVLLSASRDSLTEVASNYHLGAQALRCFGAATQFHLSIVNLL